VQKKEKRMSIASNFEASHKKARINPRLFIIFDKFFESG
jgi:hypothetical protein